MEDKAARVVRTRATLAEAVANWPGGILSTTWALVAVGEVPSSGELTALRKAAKTCDKVAAVVVPAKPNSAAKTLPTLPTLLRAAGCDVVWVPSGEKGLLELTSQSGTSPKIMLQALLAVLPSVVVVASTDNPTLRHWRLLQAEFGEVATVVVV